MKLGPRAVLRAESVDREVRTTKRIDDDPSWLNGPPYAVEEVVFDENELLGCFRTEAETDGRRRAQVSGSCGEFQLRKVTLSVTLRDRIAGRRPSGDASHRRQVAVGVR